MGVPSASLTVPVIVVACAKSCDGSGKHIITKKREKSCFPEGKKFDSHINNVKGLLKEEIAPGNKELIVKGK